jgi:hypothetical protein
MSIFLIVYDVHVYAVKIHGNNGLAEMLSKQKTPVLCMGRKEAVTRGVR